MKILGTLLLGLLMSVRILDDVKSCRLLEVTDPYSEKKVWLIREKRVIGDVVVENRVDQKVVKTRRRALGVCRDWMKGER